MVGIFDEVSAFHLSICDVVSDHKTAVKCLFADGGFVFEECDSS